jgi:Leucine-rich repeat (LRR) protein
MTAASPDSLALLAIYNSLGGTQWTNKTNWTVGPISTWHGVTVVNQRVTTIDLSQNNLSGTIPTLIANLTALVNLNLYNNSITGSIPHEIGSLSSLQFLSLSGNQLSGSIPIEIGNLTSLISIDFTSNKLSGSIPTQIGNLTSLSLLFLSFNNLSGSIPTQIGNLTSLTELDLSSNNLTGPIPHEVGNMAAMQFLSLDRNQLSGNVPPEISNLSGLQFLSLWKNQLTGSFPTAIWGMSSLLNIFISDNQLTGTIPSTVGNLSQLYQLILSNNSFSGALPTELGNATALQTLALNGNQFTGSIPSSFANLSQLKDLNLSANNFSGVLPAGIATFKLNHIDISNNQFTSIPDFSTQTFTALSSVAFNALTFASLQPNANVTNLTLGNQTIPVGDTVKVALGAALNLPGFDAAGTGTVYAWYQNNSPSTGDTQITLQRAAAQAVDAGSYYLRATNPSVLGVAIQSTAYLVEVISPSAARESGYKFWKKIGGETQGVFLYHPGAICLDQSGNIYVIQDKIYKLDNNGNQLLSFSGRGASRGLMLDPGGIVVAANGDIYVSDLNRSKIMRFDSSGNLLLEWSFTNPSGIAINPLGQIVVTALNQASQAYPISVFDTSGNLLSSLGSWGTNPGQVQGNYGFNYLNNIVIDPSGNMCLLDNLRHALIAYNSAGSFLGETVNANLQYTNFLMLDPNKHIYVGGFNQIVHFDNALNYVDTWSSYGLGPNNFMDCFGLVPVAGGFLMSDYYLGLKVFDASKNFVKSVGPSLSANGVFNNPGAIVKDSKGHRYVGDMNNGRIQKFDSKGNFLQLIGSFGTGQGQFNNVGSMAVDAHDNLFVFDSNNRIQKFAPDGSFALSFGSSGSGNGQFNGVGGISFLPNGNLVVSDEGNSRVEIFKSDGTFVSTFGSAGTGQGQFTQLNTLVTEADGTIAVLDFPTTNHPRVQKFSSNGTFVNSINVSGQSGGANYWSTDADKFVYACVGGQAEKFDGSGALVTTIGNGGFSYAVPDGGFSYAASINSNVAGDTVWVADGFINRVSIFVANLGKVSSIDSLALVDLYYGTKGSAWTNKTNWLTAGVSTWNGVSVSGGKIRSVQLPNNNLSGTLPTSITSLADVLILDIHANKLSGAWPDWTGASSMQKLDVSGNLLSGALGTLPQQLIQANLSNNKLTAVASLPTVINKADLSYNKLTQLGNMTSTALDTLKIQHNMLGFGDIENNISIPSFSYVPQDSVDLFESVLRQIGVTQTFSAAINGTANSYQWSKNGAAISGATASSLALANISFKDDATYTYQATSANVPGLTLYSNKKILRVSSLQRDSIALTALYNATKGSGWKSNSNWTTTSLGTGNWFGVTIGNNRVTGLSLPGNNLIGVVPAVFGDIQNIITVDLSGNKIKTLPDLTTLTNLATFNVSSNQLDFASLLPNVSLTGINYASQGNIGAPLDTLLTYGTDYTLLISTKGKGNVYQWTRNGSDVTGATDTTYLISKIGRSNMGTYVCEVTNPGVPNLKLTTFNERALAVATISGSFINADNSPVGKGNLYLFKVNAVGAYDSTRVVALPTDGTFSLTKVVLDDYVLLGKPDTVAFPTVLPTYYKSTIFWEQADTLQLQGNRTGITILAVTKPTQDKGTGEITGTLDDVASSSGGRFEASRRVAGAGVSCSRGQSSGKVEAGKYILTAYTLTDQNGVFTLSHLSAGNYRLDIQYPGYPMDTTSFITFTIGTTPSTKQVIVAAAVDGNKIVVKLLKITGVEEDHRFSIFPNPTKLSFNINLNETMDSANYTITDMLGHKVKTGDLNSDISNSIDVSALKAGLYVVDISQGDQVIKSFKIEITE